MTLVEDLEELRKSRIAVMDSVRRFKAASRPVKLELPTGTCLVDELTLTDLMQVIREIIE